MRSRLPRSAAVAAVLLLAGSAQTPSAQTSSRPPAPQVDPKALEVLRAADAAIAGAGGLTATYRSEYFRPNGQPGAVTTTTLRLGRPNVYYVEATTGTGAGSRTILASDGTTRFMVSPGERARCTTSKVAPLNDTRELDTFNPLYWSFYNLGEWQIRSAMLGHWVTKWRLADPGLRSVRYAGREGTPAEPLDVIEWIYGVGYNRPGDDPVYTSRLWIAADGIVRRIETASTSKDEYDGRRIVDTVSAVRVTPRPPAEQFAYRPPAGLACTPVDPEEPYTTGPYADLPIGSKAPDFALATSRGETLRLSEFLKRHKVVLMNYWGYG